MGEATSIEWTDHTFNPWRGCARVSEGCRHCYAETMSNRNPGVLGVWGPQGTRVVASEAMWRQPLAWDRAAGLGGSRRRGRVFCASLADVFEAWPGQMTDSQERPLLREPGIPADQARPFWDPNWHTPYTLAEARARLWALIRTTPQLDWQLLTKRPENIPKFMPAGDWPNVWLGVSVEDQANLWRADALQDARDLVRCPVGFLSCEPLLGPLDLSGVLGGFQWVILGGESGPHARECRLEWLRLVLAQCQQAGVPCFVKQLGARPTQAGQADHLRYPLPLARGDGKGGDPRSLPADLHWREFPRGG